jgi:tripartite-type tricarboxylate transporter receptor subunit TctC
MTVSALGLLAMMAGAQLASAQTYPARPVKLIVGYPPGGLSDVVARAIAQKLSERMHGSFVVENHVGASGTIAGGIVARAAPDGYVLLIDSPADVTNLHFMKVNYNILADFDHIGMVVEGPPLVLLVNPASPYKSVKNLVDYARSHPGKLNIGSSGPASPPSMAIALFQSMAKVKVVDVPYRGVVKAALSVAAGEIPATFTFQNTAKPLADSGKVRALASTSFTRSQSWPDLPTMIESGFPGFQFEGFIGIAAPAKTPSTMIDLINRNLNAAVQDPSFRAKFANYGMKPPDHNTPKDFQHYVEREVNRMGRLAALIHRKSP